MVLRLALSEETSPLIVVIYHFATDTHRVHGALYFPLEMSSVFKEHKLKNKKSSVYPRNFWWRALLPNYINYWYRVKQDAVGSLQAWTQLLFMLCHCFSWIFLDIPCTTFHGCMFTQWGPFSGVTTLCPLRRKERPWHTEMKTRQAFLMQNCCNLCHCVRAPRLWRNWGVSSVFPHCDECVWVEGKSLADGSGGLSSSSLPVGQEDRDGSLSAGLWLDPSP